MNRKVFMPMPNEGWIGDVTSVEFAKHTQHEIVGNINDADVIWMYSKWVANRFPHSVLVSKPCITTVHHIVPNKGIDIAYFDSFTNVYHVPNVITYSALSQLTKKPIIMLPYWVPTKFGVVNGFERDVHKKLGQYPDPKAILFGSFQRDTEGNSIYGPVFVPKLEKGPDILVDVLNRFKDENFKLILAGWRRQYIKSKISVDKMIDCTSIMPEEKSSNDLSEINDLYNVLHMHNGIYLVTARVEGGPQAILEAAITKTRILSTNVGVASTVLHPTCICGNPNDAGVVDIFESKIRNMSRLEWSEAVEYNYKKALELNISKVMPLYDDLVEKTYEL